jgi:transposase
MKFFEALSPCLVGLEACAAAHYWARELTRLGHETAKDVKAYVKRNKNDAPDRADHIVDGWAELSRNCKRIHLGIRAGQPSR